MISQTFRAVCGNYRRSEMHPEANSHWLKLQLQVHISGWNFTKAYSCQIRWSVRWAQPEKGWVETFLSCIFTESTTEQSLDVTTAEQDRLSEPLDTTSVFDDGTTVSDAVTSTSDTLIADVATSTSDTSTGEFPAFCLHKWLKRSRKFKILLTDLPFYIITCMLFSTVCFKLFSDTLLIYAYAIATHTKNDCYNHVNQTNFLVIWKALLSFVIFKEGGCISLKFASVFLLLTSFIPACKSYKA